MSVAKQQHSYQCDQCGSPNIVALPVLYEQGTRTYSSPTNWGSSQSHSAQGAAPPRRKGYGGPFLLWGFLAVILFVLVLGLLQRDAKVPKDCVIHGVPTRSLGTDGPRLRHRTCPNKSQSVPIQSSGLPRALLNVGAHIHVPPLRKAASYSFIIRVAAVEEQFPVRPAKGDAAAQFPQVFPTRVIRSRRQIVFEFGWCEFPVCPLYVNRDYFRIAGDPDRNCGRRKLLGQPRSMRASAICTC